MKQLSTYINEKLILNKDTFKNQYNYFPKTEEELSDIIKQLLEERGSNANLNDIDVSKITDMSNLFSSFDIRNIDISKWDVSNVEDMSSMFYNCYNLESIGDISKWDVSNVTNMNFMFFHCYYLESIGDISNWDISNIKDAHGMFEQCKKLSQIGNLFKWKNKSNPDAVYDNMFIGSPNLTFLDRWWEK